MPDLALLVTELLAILGASRIVGRIFRFLGQPRVIGEMAAGIALGPSVFGTIAPNAFHSLFPPHGMAPLATLSQLGVVLFMFVVGLRLDTEKLRERLRSAVLISHSSIVFPFGLGAALAVWLHPGFAPPGVGLLPFILFLGAAMSVTAFPVLARILAERGMLQTRVGSLALTCAAVDDVTAWCLLAGVVAVARAGNDLGPLVATVLGTIAYTLAVVTGGRRVLRWWDERRSDRGSERVATDTLSLSILLALASSLVTERLGVHALFGAFLAGTAVPRAEGLAHGIADRLEDTVGTLLLPIFFAFTGLRTEIGLVTSLGLWAVFAAILAIAVAGKLGASAAAARVTGMPWPEALAIGVLMNTRGLMELVILNVGLDIGIISNALFAMMVLMALTTTVMTAPLLEALRRFNGAMKRGPARALDRRVG